MNGAWNNWPDMPNDSSAVFTAGVDSGFMVRQFNKSTQMMIVFATEIFLCQPQYPD